MNLTTTKRKESCHLCDKKSQMTVICDDMSQQFINNTLPKHLFGDVLQNFW